VPIYISRDDRYFQDAYQGLPKQGYTALFQKLLDHPNIKIMLNTSYKEIAKDVTYDRMVFTGAIDEFFDHKHGELPYRSLRFNFVHDTRDQIQSVGTVNYPNEYHYTRITEFKHLSGQHAHGTTYIEEYPQAYVPGENTPYYPIPREMYRELYKEYEKEAQALNGKVVFAGRLADYQYYNMDQAIHRLKICQIPF